jgi:circadian clock protein KaiC
MSKRIETGVRGLDRVLGGGFLAHNSILLKGAPGTGKTSLGLQVLLEGIRAGEPAIVCSFEQFPQQLQRDALGYGWDLEAEVARGQLTMLYVRPDDLWASPGAAESALLSRIFEAADRTGAKRLLLDSVSHFNRLTPDPVACRSLVLKFLQEVKASGITPILTAELSAGGGGFSFEEYLVDEVVLIHNEPTTSAAALPERSIEVVKSRGHGYVAGRHPLVFGAAGIEVFPHMLPEPFGQDELAGSGLEPVSIGVAGIDRLIGGGLPKGRAAIVAGMPGAYKTTLAAAFLAEGARHGEAGLLLTFQETPQHLLRMLAGRGVDLRPAVEAGTVRVRHCVPRQCRLDQIYDELMIEVAARNVQRVVIDTVDDFERCLENPGTWDDYLGMFLAGLCRAGATTVLTQKIQHTGTGNPLADVRHVSMADTVIYLGNVEIESELRKVISVLKSRATRAEGDLREVRCDAAGLRVSHKFTGLTGILQGNARGQFKESAENIFQPLYFIRDFARMAGGAGVDDKQRSQILADILAQAQTLDAALKVHLGFDPEEEKLK